MLKQSQITRIARAGALLLALTGLGAAGSVRAAEPLSCTTSSAFPDGKGTGLWTIIATAPFETPCADGSPCTRMDYAVTGQLPDHVVVETSADVVIVNPDERYVTGTCDADPTTGLGGECHTQTVRLNAAANKQVFTLVVRGRKTVVPSTVFIKKGKITEACRIASLGADALNQLQSIPELTTIAFKTCKVNIPRSRIDGTPGIATFAPDSSPTCAFAANGAPLENLSLQVNGQPVGLTHFATDFEAGSGEGSCNTQVIKGRVYTICTCEDKNLDGRPDDGRPPCP